MVFKAQVVHGVRRALAGRQLLGREFPAKDCVDPDQRQRQQHAEHQQRAQQRSIDAAEGKHALFKGQPLMGEAVMRILRGEVRFAMRQGGRRHAHRAAVDVAQAGFQQPLQLAGRRQRGRRV